MHAPLTFIAAAIGIAPTATSNAEFACRYPVSAGEIDVLRTSLNLTTSMAVFSAGILAVFAFIGKDPPPQDGNVTPFWVPLPGAVFSAGMVLLSIFDFQALQACAVRNLCQHRCRDRTPHNPGLPILFSHREIG